MLRRSDWATIKQIATDNGGLTFYYIHENPSYVVMLGTRNMIYWSVVTESSDITDFEANYKSSAITLVSFDDGISKILIDQNTDDEIVTAINNIGVSVALAKYRPKFYLAESGFAALNNTTDTAIADLSFTGKLSAVMVRFDRDDVELVLEVDGVEKGRFNLQAFKAAGNFSLENASRNTVFPVQVSDNGKQILIQWDNIAPDVTSSLKLLAKETSTFDTGVVSIFVSYAEQV